MNNKGFTLVELLMIVALLAVVVIIAGPSVIDALNSAKDESFDIMVSDIKTSSITYFEECKYNGGAIGCSVVDNKVSVTLQQLVDLGFLTGTNECVGSVCSYVIKNPINKEDIGDCQITIEQITTATGRVEYHVVSNSTDSSCPLGDLGSVS